MAGNNIPKRPIGTSPRDQWEQRVHDVLFKELQFNDSPSVKVTKTVNGYSFKASAGGSGGTTVQLCVITQLFGGDEDEAFDYFGATPWNSASNDTSGSQIIVAKCVSARGPASELIDGQVIFYSQYLNDIQRYAYNSGSAAQEFDSIHPRYVPYPGMPPPVDDGGNALPYDNGQTIEQSFVVIATCSNPTGVEDANGNQIYYLEVNFRAWAYNPALNGG